MKKLVLLIVLLFSLAVPVYAETHDETVVKDAFIEAINDVKNLDIPNINKKYYDDYSKKIIAAATTFFNDYPEGKEIAKRILSEVEYDISSINTEDGIINLGVDFKFLDFASIIKRIIPKVLFDNAVSIFKKKTDGEQLLDILGYIEKEIEKEKKNIENKTAGYKTLHLVFKFKKLYNQFVICNQDEIIKEISGKIDEYNLIMPKLNK